MAAVDYFLKIDGIDGESTDSQHPKEIVVDSYDWGLSNRASAAHGGGSGRAAFEDLSFVAKTSKASPKLFLACASGQHIKSAVLTARKAGDIPVEFLKVTMSDLIVSAYEAGGASADAVPTDQVSLNFTKIKFEYKQQRSDGKPPESTETTWDVKRNAPA